MKKLKLPKEISKKQLRQKRKEIMERIVALDCTSGDYTKEVAELYSQKRKVEMQMSLTG